MMRLIQLGSICCAGVTAAMLVANIPALAQKAPGQEATEQILLEQLNKHAEYRMRSIALDQQVAILTKQGADDKAKIETLQKSLADTNKQVLILQKELAGAKDTIKALLEKAATENAIPGHDAPVDKHARDQQGG